LRTPRAFITQATLGAPAATTRSEGKGAETTCSIEKALEGSVGALPSAAALAAIQRTIRERRIGLMGR
jgi:hypothetical protein